MKESLENLYDQIFKKYNLEPPLEAKNINILLKDIIEEFLRDKKKPAIYCNGGHTKMLMSDFMFELKNVKYIIDNYCEKNNDSGFELITENQIVECEIDSIIISSFKFRKEIASSLNKNFKGIPVLDIYKEINKCGINLQADYYYHNHPFQHYHIINELQRGSLTEETYLKLITQFLHIKDFRMALYYVQELNRSIQNEKYNELEKAIKELYKNEMESARIVSQQNVILLCLDGLRRQDLSKTNMPKLSKIVAQKGCNYDNTYSFSTSTFESLIPVYSENGDLRTKYYLHDKVQSSDCRFIQKAFEQDRDVFFYTDMDYYIYDERIKYSNSFQTITEKIWHFLLDALDTNKGLFLIHELYESHYSFSNPYTKEKLLAEGTAMLFDYLPQKGGKLRADYIKQHSDALNYLDDTLSDFLDKLNCKILLYADHGNLILNQETKIEDINELYFTCAEDWIRVPFIEFAGGNPVSQCSKINTLMNLNDVVICMLEDKTFELKEKDYVKIARSELYNPDFRALYKKINKETELLAFECFVFKNGIKIVIFSNGIVRIYHDYDMPIENGLMNQYMYYINKIKDEITVCELKKLDIGVY